MKAVAAIVSAYVRRNPVASDQLPALIAAVSDALAGLGKAAEPVATRRVPAVPVRRSYTADAITCLDCGWAGKMLKRHLMTAHSVTPEQYREQWRLSDAYPLVAPHYASRRSELAKSFGLGKRSRAAG